MQRRFAARAARVLSTLALVATGMTVTATPSSAEPLTCEAGAFQALDLADVTITSATVLTTPTTAVRYCRVNGYVTTRGPAPTTNQVDFMLALPDVFEQRYYYIGLGGSAGIVPAPRADLLQLGYAVAGSDGGSTTVGTDYSFGWDRTLGVDFGNRAVHLTAVVTQEMTRRYYALTKPGALSRYFVGCSAGGRAANVESLMHPTDFDGIVSSAAPQWPRSQLRAGWIAKFLLDNPAAWISPAQLAQISNALLAVFDASDGAVDGLIWDPSTMDGFDLTTLGLGLTAPQIELLHRIAGGMELFGVSALGIPLSHPIAMASTVGDFPPTQWLANPSRRPAFYTAFDTTSRALYGPDYDFVTDMDFDDPVHVQGWVDTFNATFVGSGSLDPAGLEAFRRSGGKIIYWHGISDGGVSVNDTIRYYDQAADAQHGYGRLQTFARMFLAPGMNHCGGGAGPSLADFSRQVLSALTRWVEQGKPPRSLVTSTTSRSFLLCAYPERSVFQGGVDNPAGLDVNDASSWTCTRPREERAARG